ncbi:DUF2254 domain-containing protein [Erythrobacter sp. SCSIO 43205]|uniref:DUF2254 domain-containing protein n=1 Tax=Erythrobacter sp. SCSIO 43205 TaxID=2779361 RepID=UPI001CA8C288|nr:DUF2254 domain-containing protein [Erythrobacter sp. SCSIO 43205]UAB77953.1 DUF2254 domain-containing protein [Erythrobacter sp. SCSIO 43205]
MTAEIRFFWARLNANYWFYPATFAILAAVLGFVAVYLDRNGFAQFLSNYDWLVPVRPKGAVDILTVMAGTMIGVASTVFSITLVAVTYASSSYGPRLLTNFLEDKGNQVSLAAFIGTFVYTMIVLRSVRAEDEVAASTSDAVATNLPGFAPQLSLLIAYLMVGACVGVLVFFLHHVPSSIRISMVLEKVGKQLLNAVRDTYPIEEEFRDARQSEGGETIAATSSGYVQMIDFEDLEHCANEHGCILSLRVRTGDFVHRDLPLLDVKGASAQDLREAVQPHFTLGPVRTREQDPQYLIDQLVEIGLRALSPGINDPFTAITALHWLGAVTSEIARRDLRKDVCGKDADECPVIPLPDTYEHYLQRGLGSMRSAVATSHSATMVMLDVIAKAAHPVTSSERKAGLRNQADLLIEQAREHLVGADLRQAEERYREVQQLIPS